VQGRQNCLPNGGPETFRVKIFRLRPLRYLAGVILKTHVDRGAERYRRAGLAASAGICSQILGLAISLVSVPLTVRYLGQERYGVWLTISSIVTWMAMTDFGLTGTALVNLISEAHGRDDRTLAREYASSTFWALAAITILLGSMFAFFFDRIPWQSVFRISQATSLRELRLTCALTGLIFLLGLPMNMFSSIYNAYQDGLVANLWTIGGNLGALLGLVGVTHFRGGLPALVIAVTGTRVLVGLTSGCYLFFWRYPWLRPRISAMNWQHVKRVVRLSSKYMILQISGLTIGQSQPMIITQVLGPAAVPAFVVTYRLITIPQAFIFIATTPLIAAYGEARARGDWAWIRSAFRRSTTMAIVGSAGLIATLALFVPTIVKHWAGSGVAPDPGLLLWLSAYAFAGAVSHPASQFLWGVERVGRPAFALAVSAVLTVVLSQQFGRMWGLSGVAAALTVSYLLFCLAQACEIRSILGPFGSSRDLKRAEASGSAISA
jgi:O-antigen/teichoic acid export membrane protein